MSNIVKVCLKHGYLKEDEAHKEKNNSKKGFSFRCNQCKLEKDRRWKDANREKHRASAGAARNSARAARREAILEGNDFIDPKANIWKRNDRKNDRLKYAAYEKKHKDKIGIENYRRREVLRAYGLTIQEHDQLIQSQNNKCAICKKEETRIGRNGKSITPLCIDHCHKTLKVRGLLCHACNTGMGKFKENIEILQEAINYLKKHNT